MTTSSDSCVATSEDAVPAPEATSPGLLTRFFLMLLAPRRRRWTQQLSSTDCGAATLSTVLNFWGRATPLNETRALLPPTRDGTSARDLLEAGRACGLEGRGVALEATDIDQLPTHSILFWNDSHFVVLDRATSNAVDLLDPSIGPRRLTRESFAQGFGRIALVFEPGPAFERRAPSRRQSEALKIALLAAPPALVWKSLMASLGLQALSIGLSYFGGALVGASTEGAEANVIPLVVAAGLAVALVQYVTLRLRAIWLRHLRFAVDRTLNGRFMQHLLRLPYGFFQVHSVGDLANRIASNEGLRETITGGVASLVLDGVMAVSSLVIIAGLDPVAATLTGGLGLAVHLVTRLQATNQRAILATGFEVKARAIGFQHELLNGIETIKSLGTESSAGRRWATLFNDATRIDELLEANEGLYEAIARTVRFIGPLLILSYLASHALERGTSAASLFVLNGLVLGFLFPVESLAHGLSRFQVVGLHLERIDDVLQLAAEQDGPCTPERLEGALRLRDVSFRYAPRSEAVLREVSFDVAAGQSVAIVGRTGCGKSTLARLMAGLFTPVTGSIEIDGRPLGDYGRQALRAQIAVVPQEAQLFAMSIRDNILLGHEVDDGFLRECIDAAALTEDLELWPMGLETMLTDRGTSLSGGQRQRLALARALARGPRVLILDEATSALDPETEQRVHRNLAAMRCTRISITHRLSAVQNADQIIVMSHGEVVDRGRHHELLSRCSAYATLAQVGAPSATAPPSA